MRYVGITGFTTRAEVDAALDALPAGLTLMCGVLVSEKTLRGERNKHWRRYPQVEDIAGIFSDDPRCLNLIHYCADEPPDEPTIDQLCALDSEHLHGFQFNVAWPKPSVLQTYGGIHVVLQVRPDGGPGTIARMRASVEAMPECQVHVLIDASGGRGVAIDPEVADVWGMMIRGHFGQDVGLAFAGGLDAESLPRISAEVQSYGASIDAEGRLRDGDEGGDLNLDKVRAYLAAAECVMQGNQ